MASLAFYYSSMNSGKSLMLIKLKYDYEYAGKAVICLTPSMNKRDGIGIIKSRALNTRIEAFQIPKNKSVINIVEKHILYSKLDLILVDEAQFLNNKQIEELAHLSDNNNIHVMCFGLRTDSNGELFEGSSKLLAISDKLIEVKNTCHCGKKATMTLRLDESGKVSKNEPQISIGGNDSYKSVCRKHWYNEKIGTMKK
jgi:thymidine kinase